MAFKKGHKVNVGRHHSEETKKKMSQSNKGKVRSLDFKRNLSVSRKEEDTVVLSMDCLLLNTY